MKSNKHNESFTNDLAEELRIELSRFTDNSFIDDHSQGCFDTPDDLSNAQTTLFNIFLDLSTLDRIDTLDELFSILEGAYPETETRSQIIQTLEIIATLNSATETMLKQLVFQIN